jgi:manganese transport protein
MTQVLARPSGAGPRDPVASSVADPRVLPRIRRSTVLGPAFVAAIAYLDPGNFATNFSSGATLGYRLMWVVLAASIVAMPIQYLSAKLGIVTGRSLPELCRDTLPAPAAWALWAQAEAVAMATDVAEFVGAAIGLNLLFHVPLLVAGLMTGALAFTVLAFQRRGHRPFEIAIGALMALICAGFLYETLRIGPSASGAAAGLIPRLGGHDSLLLAVGIVGATVMPHAVYLHSGLTSRRLAVTDDSSRRRVLRVERLDVALALGVAALVNLSMLAVAAKLFSHSTNVAPVTLEIVHSRIGHLLGGGAAIAFAAALLASGISSSAVGTCAGDMIMAGFIGRRIPVWLRRLITMIPALVLLAAHVNPTRALIISQVVLCFGVPFVLIPLIRLTSSRRLMGEHVNARRTTVTMSVVVAALCVLNVFLLVQQFTS